MRLLLDTNVFLWLQGDRVRIGRHVGVLAEPANELVVSAVVAWEISIKHALGRLPLPGPPTTFVPEAIRDAGASTIPITHGHALGVAALPPIHGDPFDRLLVAQALALGATLVTGDAVLAGYPAETLLV